MRNEGEEKDTRNGADDTDSAGEQIRPNHCNRESKDRGLLLAMKPFPKNSFVRYRLRALRASRLLHEQISRRKFPRGLAR